MIRKSLSKEFVSTSKKKGRNYLMAAYEGGFVSSSIVSGAVETNQRLNHGGRLMLTSHPQVVTSELPHHWRCNKTLPETFQVFFLKPVPDNSDVSVTAANDDNPCAQLRNSTTVVVNNVATFNDLRFIGRSGRGKLFNVTIHMHCADESENITATLSEVIKVTVDGPRVPRRRRGGDDSNDDGSNSSSHSQHQHQHQQQQQQQQCDYTGGMYAAAGTPNSLSDSALGSLGLKSSVSSLGGVHTPSPLGLTPISLSNSNCGSGYASSTSSIQGSSSEPPSPTSTSSPRRPRRSTWASMCPSANPSNIDLRREHLRSRAKTVSNSSLPVNRLRSDTGSSNGFLTRSASLPYSPHSPRAGSPRAANSMYLSNLSFSGSTNSLPSHASASQLGTAGSAYSSMKDIHSASTNGSSITNNLEELQRLSYSVSSGGGPSSKPIASTQQGNRSRIQTKNGGSTAENGDLQNRSISNIHSSGLATRDQQDNNDHSSGDDSERQKGKAFYTTKAPTPISRQRSETFFTPPAMALRALLPSKGCPGQYCIAVAKLSSIPLGMSERTILMVGDNVPLQIIDVMLAPWSMIAYVLFRVPMTHTSPQFRVTSICCSPDGKKSRSQESGLFSYTDSEPKGVSEVELGALMLMLHFMNLDNFLKMHEVVGPQSTQYQLLLQFSYLEEGLFIRSQDALARLGAAGRLPSVDVFSNKDQSTQQQQQQQQPQLGVNEPTTSQTGLTVLHLAAEFGWMKILRALLCAGAHINQTDSLGNTALDWALMSGQTEISDVLTRLGGSLRTFVPSTSLDTVVTHNESDTMSCYLNSLNTSTQQQQQQQYTEDLSRMSADSLKMHNNSSSNNNIQYPYHQFDMSSSMASTRNTSSSSSSSSSAAAAAAAGHTGKSLNGMLSRLNF